MYQLHLTNLPWLVSCSLQAASAGASGRPRAPVKRQQGGPHASQQQQQPQRRRRLDSLLVQEEAEESEVDI